MPNLINRSNTTILITDDNPVNVKIIQAILDKNGYRTAKARNGAECIEVTKRLKPNLILLDINMPGMNGIEVCRVIKKDQQTIDIPIIFVTANTDNATLKETFESGGTDYVRKPINRIELLARIQSALHQFEKEKLKGIIVITGAICHEMNQPLQAAIILSELILSDITADNSLYTTAGKLKEQIDRMGEITRKLMSITRYETKDYLKTKIIDIDKASMEVE